MNSIDDVKSFQDTPYVGVHVTTRLITMFNQQNFNQSKEGKKKARLQKMNQIAKTNLYFFSETDVDFDQKLIVGTYYDTEKNQWMQAKFPFPDVYYNRRSSRLIKGNIVYKIWDTLDKMNIPSINTQHYFDKWHVYQQLMQYEDLRPHLPETRYYNNSNDIKIMFEKSSRLFLKSLCENNGIGIMCVTKKSNGYGYTHYSKSSLKTDTVNNFNDLIMEINSFYKGEPFIIQKAIDLLQFNHKTSDLRSEVQRNGQGRLEYVAHSVRVGKKHSHITNTRTNSTVYPFDDFFKNKMGYTNDEVKKLNERLEKLLLNIYQKIEASYGRFGEIGIDIGIDKNGRLWLIECNAKPGKNTLWVHDEQTIDRAYLNPLEYAKFIAKKNTAKNSIE